MPGRCLGVKDYFRPLDCLRRLVCKNSDQHHNSLRLDKLEKIENGMRNSRDVGTVRVTSSALGRPFRGLEKRQG